MYPPELKTIRFTLKAYVPKDEDRFVEMALDEVSVRFMGGATGIEQEERQLFQKILELYQKNDKRWFWVWGIYRDELLYGHLELKETAHTNEEELEMVYMVHPKERRLGVMSEVLSLIKQQQRVWKKRIIATLSPENATSISLLKKWGIEKEKCLIDDETAETYLKISLTV